MTEQLTGGCHCGSVRYRLNGPVKMAVNCHCNDCRKRNGAAYSTYCVVAQDDLEIRQGREGIATYDVDGRGQKHFCSKCGSPLYNAIRRYPGVYMLFHGSLAPTAGPDPVVNVYCESKLPWVDGIAAIKSFEQSSVR